MEESSQLILEPMCEQFISLLVGIPVSTLHDSIENRKGFILENAISCNDNELDKYVDEISNLLDKPKDLVKDALLHIRTRFQFINETSEK